MVTVIALLLALASVTPRDRVDAKRADVSLDVAGSAGCVSRAELVARIAARSTRIHVSAEAPIIATATVLSRRTGEVTATLKLVTPGSDGAPRRVVAANCAELADALALIIAVSLDPTPLPVPARNVPRSAAAAVKDAPALSAAPASNAGPAPTPNEPGRAAGNSAAEAAGNPAPPRTVPPVAPAAPPVRPTPEEPTTDAGDSTLASNPAPIAPRAPTPSSLQVAAALVGQGFVGPAPDPLLGLGLDLLIASQRAGWWSPALLIGATHTARSTATAGGTASFALDAASLDACPLRWTGPWFWARPCATLLLGRLSASGRDTLDPASTARPFGAAGAALNAGFGREIQAWARVGAAATLLKDSYRFSSEIFHRAGDLTFSASLGVGVLWP